ncbi:hypothetical protein F0562_030589 [Nyssa sinensis]|uniref:DUF4283 domain-containing protein n=1 Tax=Nyssa sinensis TaxID=561372 RepID=A0A5J5AWT3_9ASTE|nr:hypothetical protein F0562_030589 [Nyssa sinensis]
MGPIWVRLIGVPAFLWSPEVLGGRCGSFVMMDDSTEKHRKWNYLVPVWLEVGPLCLEEGFGQSRVAELIIAEKGRRTRISGVYAPRACEVTNLLVDRGGARESWRVPTGHGSDFLNFKLGGYGWLTGGQGRLLDHRPFGFHGGSGRGPSEWRGDVRASGLGNKKGQDGVRNKGIVIRPR